MSDDPDRIHNFDLEIFKNDDTKCIKPQNDEVPITESCSFCMRLCCAMRYFDAITASKLDDEEKRTLFVEFNEVVYRSVLDDTAHFIKEHCNDLKRIWKEWNEKYGVKKCSVWDCTKMKRQYVFRWNEMEEIVPVLQ